MRKILEDNEISPEKLHVALGIFISEMNQIEDVKSISGEVEYFLLKDVVNGTEGFMTLLELGKLFIKQTQEEIH